jgi:GNAT superfamily N-acetyltransferase
VKPKRTGACAGLKLRATEARDSEAMGALLLDAYRGTIDDEGEDMRAAIGVARDFFAGANGRVQYDITVGAWRGETLVAVCAVAWLDTRACPFVAYAATASEAKRQGVGRLVVGESVRRAGKAGHKEIRAFITEGNTPSERLFGALGFEPVRESAPKS